MFSHPQCQVYLFVYMYILWYFRFSCASLHNNKFLNSDFEGPCDLHTTRKYICVSKLTSSHRKFFRFQGIAQRILININKWLCRELSYLQYSPDSLEIISTHINNLYAHIFNNIPIQEARIASLLCNLAKMARNGGTNDTSQCVMKSAWSVPLKPYKLHV